LGTREHSLFKDLYRAIAKKIEDDPDNPTLIITEPGVGYRLTIL
jgi:DNA-binding response OmpR family regulator